MPSEPFRFLHASQLRLDEPLAGTGPLDSDARVIAEDATLTALESTVDSCLAHGVEFLLLTGATFGCEALTLRGRRALLTAFETLCEFDIQVFWEIDREQLTAVVGETVQLPGNVSPIHPGDAEPVAVVRQGRVIASVSSARREEIPHSAGEAPGDRSERGAFRIGVAEPAADDGRPPSLGPQHRNVQSIASDVEDAAAACDYVALNSTGRRTTLRAASSLAHDPGPTQGTSARETGSHGATLVCVDAECAAELTFVPTAPVRWERVLVGIDRDLDCEQLAEHMQSALLELERAPAEQLWIVNWQMIGNGNLFDALHSGGAVEGLQAAVDRGLVVGSNIRRADRFRFRRRLAQHTDELMQQMAAWIGREDADPTEDIHRELHENPEADWLKAVTQLLPLVDRSCVVDTATRLSQELLLHSAQPATQQEQAAR